ncbi:hypothetical protein NIES21_26860 [Anabaenopsis circularis NIES-21]|uniref:Cytochrome c domain-containing protein n=1 Tax=Anabaenopsis circularis NIES-21 TaxID=1085406 RepID=A0A1Z4GH86_9CYAN|nr:hypothetical protein NIES21_26860 [Anabaenopsis circularis NIES-21]
MNKIRLLWKGCLVVFAATAITFCGWYSTPIALASEYSETPAPISNEYNDAAYTDNCDGIGYLPPYTKENLTEAEKRGRCTWYLWTGGNATYYRDIAKRTHGGVDLLQLINSKQYDHDQRLQRFGAINDPGCEKAKEEDEYGFLLDKCKDPLSTGVIGLRKFPNPKFDKAKWNYDQYIKDSEIEPPYLIGQSCAICHVALDPLNPPKDKEHPQWENLVPALGNQYIKESELFSTKLRDDSFIKQVLDAQRPGTSDTSRIATDHINNPNAINAIFNLGDRPTYPEVMNDGSTKNVNHILKDGADSTGVAIASLRVYVNIGMCGDYWLSLHEAMLGRTPQRPFDIETARKNCEGWRQTEARMADAEAFLKTIQPMHLKDAPGGEAFLTKDEKVLERGKIVFADTCASCHSSKKPPAEIAADPDQAKKWYEESVLSSNFLDHNFLSDDQRYPATLIGTNISRSLGTNATKGHIWDQFSSKTYKELPSPGELTLYNPFNEAKPINFPIPEGGLGYYRTPSLISVWATAPFLHNNTLGLYNEDPSVKGRIDAYTDAMEKMLWPEKREGIISRTDRKTKLDLPPGDPNPRLRLPVPKGMPVNLLANVNMREAITSLNLGNLFQDLRPEGGIKGKLARVLLRANKSPDFVEDRGHTFGANLSDDDKKALIEFVKNF